MKILITGGAGFIGSNLSAYFVGKKDSVFAIDNFITGSQKNIDSLIGQPNFKFFKKDLCLFQFSEIPPVDYIFHLASPASPDKYKKYPLETLAVNSQGTKNLLEFMLKSRSKVFVLASTSEVYGDPLVHPQREDYWGNVNPAGERSCYDEGKRFAEALTMSYFRKYKIDLRIARIFNTYGPNMEKNDGRVISNFIVQSLGREPVTVYGDGQQTRSCCYVSDMVTGLLKLATTGNLAGETINLGGTDERKVVDLARLIKKMAGSSSEIIFKPKPEDDPQKRKPDISKAIKLLGWQPEVTLEDGLTKTIEYFRERYF